MFELFKKIKILKFIIIILLVGCAGSSSNSYKENSLYDTNSTKISELKLIMVDGKTLNIKTDAGSFSRINGQTVIKLNSSEDTVAFIESQNKKLKTSYVTIVPEGNLYGGSFGLLGIDPQNSRLSDGEYIYNGNAEVFINDGNALYGLSGDSKVPISSFEENSPLVVIVGAENKGISLLTQKKCDYLLKIPLKGKTSSLNASVAAAISLYSLTIFKKNF